MRDTNGMGGYVYAMYAVKELLNSKEETVGSNFEEQLVQSSSH